MLRMLRDILKQDIPVKAVTRRLNREWIILHVCRLMHLIFGIAIADGTISGSETMLVEQIALDLGINAADIQSIKSMFIQSADWAYKVLEVDRNASNETIKKAYANCIKKSS